MASVKRTTLATVTNGTDETYYYYFQPGGYELINLHGILSAGSGSCTVTLETSSEDVATSDKVTSWVDTTALCLGSANYTATFLKTCYKLMAGFTWARVKVVASTGGANDADWKLYLSMVDFGA